MVPIIIAEDKEFNEESFKNFLIESCKQHKIEKRALVFAFIIYDFSDHTISQILKKQEYWNSLDKISGKALSIFYINSQDDYYKNRQYEIYLDELRQQNTYSAKGYISYFVPITIKPTPADNAIELLREEFEIDKYLKTPFVLFFQVEEETISDSFIISLKQDMLEEAFLELRDHIRNAVSALKKLKPEHHDNHQEVFNLVKGSVENGRFQDFVSKKTISKFGIGTIISLIRTLFGS